MSQSGWLLGINSVWNNNSEAMVWRNGDFRFSNDLAADQIQEIKNILNLVKTVSGQIVNAAIPLQLPAVKIEFQRLIYRHIISTISFQFSNGALRTLVMIHASDGYFEFQSNSLAFKRGSNVISDETSNYRNAIQTLISKSFWVDSDPVFAIETFKRFLPQLYFVSGEVQP